jgi:hypothetical protein
MAGSSAAEMAMANRLTGSVLMDCELVSAVTAPTPTRLAITWSTYPLICTTPRLTKTGTKFRSTSRTCAPRVSSRSRSLRASRSTTGNCTPNCNALPITEPHARSTAKAPGSAPPNAARVAIMAAFQITGAV